MYTHEQVIRNNLTSVTCVALSKFSLQILSIISSAMRFRVNDASFEPSPKR